MSLRPSIMMRNLDRLALGNALTRGCKCCASSADNGEGLLRGKSIEMRPQPALLARRGPDKVANSSCVVGNDGLGKHIDVMVASMVTSGEVFPTRSKIAAAAA